MRMDQYIGLPFKDHGRDRSGVDCWGLVRLILAEQYAIGDLPEPDYLDTKDMQGIPAAILFEATRWLRVEVAACGDLIVLNIGGRPMHIGFVVEDGLMLHVEEGFKGALIESYTGPKWGSRIEGIYRYGR